MDAFDRPTPAESRLYARRVRLAAAIVVALVLLALPLLDACAPNRPRDDEDATAHFYYGSVGSDISGGLPLKVMQVLPRVFPDLLPPGSTARDYTAFGFIQEPGRPMPIGFSIRRRGIDFTALNCGACHTGSVRTAPGQPPRVIPGMPANTLNLLAYFKFLFQTVNDHRFNTETILAAMEDAGLKGPLDGLIYRRVIPTMRDALRDRERKLRFLLDPRYTEFGPGRVGTFDAFKFDQFADYYQAHAVRIEPHEIYGIVDFPSVWNQAPREGLSLHWDGNNDSVRERNFSAAIAAGARPEDMDLDRLYRIEDWLKQLPPPAYPFPVDVDQAARGGAVYRRYCADCHDFGGSRMGEVIPVAAIGTDRHRLDSYTEALLAAQKDYTKGQNWAFSHFTKTDGYANQPLDGIWARAPYLHNGSVPTMWDLLQPESERPEVFTIGHDVYDPTAMGFRHAVLRRDGDGGYQTEDGEPYTGTAFVLDTTLRANGNHGHSGAAYGTALSDADKQALIEYLKTR